MSYTILTSDRKQVVKRLEELAGKRAVYSGVPRMVYSIEGITVERDGTVTAEAEANMELIETLISEGLIQGSDTEADAETEAIPEIMEISGASVTEQPAGIEETPQPEELTEDGATIEETAIEPEAETTMAEETAEPEAEDLTDELTDRYGDPPQDVLDLLKVAEIRAHAGRTGETDEPEDESLPGETEDLTDEEEANPTCDDEVEEPETADAVKPGISFPLAAHRPESMINLVCTIYTRGSLLSKATGGKFSASEELVKRLQTMTGLTRMDDVLQTIREMGGLQGLTIADGKVTFDGFPETGDADAIRAWTVLSAAMNKSAIKQIHVRAKKVDETNEKFAFRTWLTRLGMNGSEYKAERNILYRNLSGHTAFRTAKDEEKWKARQAAKKEELRASQEGSGAEG